MFEEKQEKVLEFCRDLSRRPDSTIEILMEAVAKQAPFFRLSLLTVDISENKDFMPEADTRFIALFQDPDQSDKGEPITFRFRVSHEGETLVMIYPKGEPFSEDEKKYFETLTNITFFYFGRIRFTDVVAKSAMTQYLTGLPNAGGYMMKSVELFRKGELIKYTAYYFNIRGFGLISRKYGQQESNFIIKRYAEELKKFIEKDEVLGHLGGDNFVALVKKERRNAFLALVSSVPAEAEHLGKTELLSLSASVGVFEIDEKLKDPGEVISLPSIAMNLAKNVLHQPVAEITDELLMQVDRQKEVLKSFHAALENKEFSVYYQPKVDSRNNELVGAEGLVRWFKDGKMVSPGVFIPPLEQEGMIIHLDFYVLQRACEDINRWIEEGLEPVTVSVNFSRKDLSDKNLAEHIYETIVESGVDKKYIQIEVTETMDEAEHGVLTAFLDELYQMGIQTAIDDFGAGYSSLSTLREFKVHTLKIDRSFINTETFSKKDEIILTDIIHMAHELGMHVITEGVERDDQLKFVNEAGCHYIQGFYYDKPLPEEDYKKRLLNKKYD